MSNSPQLFLWFDRDPTVFPPDTTIDDIPNVADIDLLTAAISTGKLGKILPSRIMLSTHEQPASAKTVRTVDIGRLLRDSGITHRRCYQIELPDPD
jgi:hypothetical protein